MGYYVLLSATAIKQYKNIDLHYKVNTCLFTWDIIKT